MKTNFNSNEQSIQLIKMQLPSFNNRAASFKNIKLNDVMYLEADINYTVFHLQNGKKIITGNSMSRYEKTLSKFNFIRTHKSFIINVLHLKNSDDLIDNFITMENGKEIEVSRRKKTALKTVIAGLGTMIE